MLSKVSFVAFSTLFWVLRGQAAQNRWPSGKATPASESELSIRPQNSGLRQCTLCVRSPGQGSATKSEACHTACPTPDVIPALQQMSQHVIPDCRASKANRSHTYAADRVKQTAIKPRTRQVYTACTSHIYSQVFPSLHCRASQATALLSMHARCLL